MARYRTEFVVCLALALLTAAAFARCVGNGFVNYDDGDYVTGNRHVLGGLTFANASWALTATRAANWHPLTWLSLQLDATLFGPDAWGFHLTNVLLHVANTVLLFLTLRRLTGVVWPSAAVAAFFGVHPLHVESVAWIAERKDVLSGLFWILTLLAYARYAEKPGVARYLVVAATFALGLAAKPMLVTLPCVLLLLDYWPLQRFGIDKEGRGVTVRRVFLEKVPLFALTVAACAVTVYAQKRGGAVSTLTQLSFGPRLLNSIHAYLVYLGQTFAPMKLAPFYPHPREGLEVGKAALAGLLLVAATAVGVLLARRRVRSVLVGWLWFVGTLVPVIGLVQVGAQAHADRYTYIPHIGLFIAVVWGVADLTRPMRHRGILFGIVASVALALCTLLTVRQCGFWHNSTWLWEWTTQVTRDNWIGYNNLGDAYLNSVDPDRHVKAAEQFRKTLQLVPGHAKAHNNLGVIAMEQGQLDQALTLFAKAADLDPTLAQVPDNRGVIYRKQGKLKEAAEEHRRALAINPDLAAAHANLGYVLIRLGDLEGAETSLRQAVRLARRPPAYRAALADVLERRGDKDEAERLRAAIRAADPDWFETAERPWRSDEK